MNIVEPIRDKKTIKLVEKILANDCKRNLLIFIMGINSGLRISDILSLNIDDVKNKSHIELIEKKTGKYKKFPINDKLKTLIDSHIKTQKNNEPLFKSRLNNRLDRVQAWRIINSACKKAKISYKVGTHTLRKTFGYHHYQQFKDIVMLQKIFNHSSPSTTLRYIGIEQDKIDESYMKFTL